MMAGSRLAFVAVAVLALAAGVVDSRGSPAGGAAATQEAAALSKISKPAGGAGAAAANPVAEANNRLKEAESEEKEAEKRLKQAQSQQKKIDAKLKAANKALEVSHGLMDAAGSPSTVRRRRRRRRRRDDDGDHDFYPGTRMISSRAGRTCLSLTTYQNTPCNVSHLLPLPSVCLAARIAGVCPHRGELPQVLLCTFQRSQGQLVGGSSCCAR